MKRRKNPLAPERFNLLESLNAGHRVRAKHWHSEYYVYFQRDGSLIDWRGNIAPAQMILTLLNSECERHMGQL